MTLQSSGTMSLSDVNVELTKAAGATIDTANASLSFTLSAPHSFNQFYGQANLAQNNIFFVFADFQDELETDGYRGWGDGQLNLCAESDTFGAQTIDSSGEFLVTSASKPDGSLVHQNSEFFVQQPISNGDIAYEQSGVGDLTNIRPGGTNIDSSNRDWVGNTSSSYLRDAETPNLFRISSSGEIDRVTVLDPNGGADPTKELASVSTNTIGFTVTTNSTTITRLIKIRNGSDVGSHTAVTNKGIYSTTANSNTTVNFTGLSSGTTFNFRVRAENDSNHQGAAVATSSLSFEVAHATSASGGGGGGCFVPGSKVLMADGTTKKIENVQVGDSVMSMNIPDLPSSDDWDTYKDFTTSNLDSATLTTSSVHSNTTIESKESYEEIGLSNGTTLKVTEHHPFFIYRDGNYKWAKPISEFDGDLFLRDKDKLVTKDKELITINTIQSVVSSSDVYDLNVEDSDVYFVDGVLVHNKVGA